MKLEIKKIGNSTGLILPKELLARLKLKEGDKLHLTEEPERGFKLSPYDPKHAEAMRIAALVAAPAVGATRPPGAPGLTPREQDVLRCLIRGYSDKEIASELAISRHTVAKHVTAILGKFDVDSRTGAVAAAMRHGYGERAEQPAVTARRY